MHRGSSIYGGFMQHVEHSIYGLKRLGHEVDFYFIGSKAESNEKLVIKKLQEYLNGELEIEKQRVYLLDKGIGTGEYFHNHFGWFVPTTPLGTLKQKQQFKEKLESYDAVFWHTPFWFKQEDYQKDTTWPMLLDLKHPVNIAFHHDGNIRANSSWLYFIMPYFDRIITVHPASYNACGVFDTPRCMIFNPQILDGVDYSKSNFHTIAKKPTFFSLQNWKASKHVDDLIRAIPHVYFENPETEFLIGGKGLEYYYMMSKTKVKKQYLVNPEIDPDINKRYYGRYILKLAKKCNTFILFWMSAEERDVCFKSSSFFIDTAYYTISKEYGEHFSRVLIEAIMNGIVPISRNLGLSNNEEGIGDIFKPDENYLMIPYDATPKQFADKMLSGLAMSEKKYNKIVQNNYKLLKHFDVDYVCKQYIDVIEGKPTGWYKKYETGKADKKFIEKASRTWYGIGDKRNFSFKR